MNLFGEGDTWTPPRIGLYFCYHITQDYKVKSLLLLLLYLLVLLSGCVTVKPSAIDEGAKKIAEVLKLESRLEALSKTGGGFISLLLSTQRTQSISELDEELLKYSRYGYAEKVEECLGQGAWVNATTKYNDSALFLAVSADSIATGKLLLKRGAEVNVQGSWDLSPLMEACAMNNADLVRVLLYADANVNAQSNEFNLGTPLMIAARKGDVDTVNLLLGFGADVNIRTQYGYTALHFAVSTGNPQLVKLLVDAGADVYAETDRGVRPIDRIEILVERHYYEILNLLYEADLKYPVP